MKFTVAKNDLKLAERIKIKRLGKVTVRTARDHLSGGTLGEVIGLTLVLVVFSLAFTPCIVAAVTTPLWVPLWKRKQRARLAALLPVQNDNDILEVV